MKTHRLVCLCLSSSFLLAGCALSNIVSPGNSEDFFRVDLYSDYAGMEEDIANKSMATSKALHVGYCYAKKGGAMNIDGLQVAQGAHQYTKSTRTAPAGHHYTFKDWIGFYGDGTAIDYSKVTANCSLFANFDAIKNLYAVTLRNTYEDVFGAMIEYETKLGDTKYALTSDTYGHDPENRGGDPYYLEYLFDGYQVKKMDDEGKVTSTEIYPTYNELNELVITSATEITVKYKGITDGAGKFREGLEKKFDVTIKPYDELGNPLTFDSGDSSVLLKVTYNEGITSASIGQTVAGKEFVRFEGRYDAADPELPPSLLDSSEDPAVGRPFDANHVRYKAEIKAIYGEAKKKVTVNFHDKATPTQITFEEGDVVSFPANNVEVGEGYSFAGFFVAEDGSFTEFDKDQLFTIEGSTLDLYPAKVPTRLYDKIGQKRFYYHYDANRKGYVLENFAMQDEGTGDLLTDKSLVSLAASDFLNADRLPTSSVAGYTTYDALLAKFAFLAIESFTSAKAAGAPGSSAERINSLALPDSVVEIMDSGCEGLHKLYYEPGTRTLDLSSTKITKIGSYAFKGNINVEKVIMPNGIASIGSYAFKDCEHLTEIHLPAGKTEDQFSENWNYSKPGEAGKITVIIDA